MGKPQSLMLPTLIPKHVVNDVFHGLHGELGKHPRKTETTFNYRRKYYQEHPKQIFKTSVSSYE